MKTRVLQKNIGSVIQLALILLSIGLFSTAWAQYPNPTPIGNGNNFVADFYTNNTAGGLLLNPAHNYLTTGLAAQAITPGAGITAKGTNGTIWEGMYAGDGSFPNELNDGSIFAVADNTTAPGFLTLHDYNTEWEFNTDNGFFLYKIISGDFQVVVHLEQPYNANAYNTAGLLARAFQGSGAPLSTVLDGQDPTVNLPTNAYPTESWVSLSRFDEFGFANYIRITTNNNTDQINPNAGAAVGSYGYWMMIERVGDQFNFYQSTNQLGFSNSVYNNNTNIGATTDVPPWQGIGTYTRADLHGLPLQVGIFHSTFNVGGLTAPLPAVFDHFSITNANLNPATVPAGSSNLVIGSSAGTLNGALTASWNTNGGDNGSLVILTTNSNARFRHQPSSGISYTANTNFQVGQNLGDGDYVVYVGKATNLVLPVPGVGFGSYRLAVYNYLGTNSTIYYGLTNSLTSFAVAGTSPISGVTINGLSSQLLLNGSAQAQIQATWTDGASGDVTSVSTFSSSAPNIISVTAGGQITALAHGSATITATFSTFAPQTITVTVIDPPAPVLANDYGFNESAGSSVAVDSVGGANGIYTNLLAPGSADTSLILTGTQADFSYNPTEADYVLLPPNLIKNYPSVTFEMWVNDTEAGGPPGGEALFSFGSSIGSSGLITNAQGSISNQIALYFAGNAGALTGSLSTNANFQGDDFITGGSLPVGSETHIIFTIYAPSKTAELYINGSLVAVSSGFQLNPQLLGGTSNDWIGLGGASGDPLGISANFDEFRIYNGAMSSLQAKINDIRGPGTAFSYVNPASLTGITLTYPNNSMGKGQTQIGTATANFPGVSGGVPITSSSDTTYSSSDSTTVSVSPTGVISAHKLGTATITATYLGQQSSELITVAPFDPTGFAHSMQITFSGYQNNEVLTNFPALVELSTSIPGFDYSQFLAANGGDLRILANGSNELSYEVVGGWNPSGTTVLWVQVPALSKGTELLALWGKSSLTTPAYTTNGSVYDTNFVADWHMETPFVPDATGNGFNASTIAVPGDVSPTTGIVGSALDYQGTANNGGVTFVGNVQVTNTTLSCWINLQGAEGSGNSCWMAKEDGSMFFWWQGAAVRFEWNPYGGDTTLPDNAFINAWNYVTVTVQTNGTGNATATFYVNGVAAASWTKVAPTWGNAQFDLGGNVDFARPMQGFIDEARVEKVARDAAWISAAYNNMSSPTTFETFGPINGAVSGPITLNAPSVIAISGISATIEATVPSSGGLGLTSWGATVGTSPSPRGNQVTVTGTTSTPFVFDQVIPNLTQGTHYYVDAFAANGSGTVFSPDSQFYTVPAQVSGVTFNPVLNNSSGVSWTANSAEGGALVVVGAAPLTGGPSVGVTYTAGQALGNGTVKYVGTSSGVVSGLLPGHTYYVAVYAFAGSGTSIVYATPATGSFITPNLVPTLTGTNYVDAIQALRPLAYWRLNEPFGSLVVQDSSGDGYTGTVGSQVTLGVPGPTNSSGQPLSIFEAQNTAALITTDGTTNGSIETTPLNNPMNTVTIVAWVCPTNALLTGGVLPDRATVWDERTVSQSEQVGIRGTADGSHWSYQWNSTANNVGAGLAPINYNTWSMLVLAVNATNATMYEGNNGVFTAYPNTAANQSYAVQGFTAYGSIGVDPLVPAGRDYSGYIDEVSIFPYTLTAAQLQGLYQGAFVDTVQLTLQKSGSNLILTYPEGTLQSASAVTGPFTTIPNAASPYTVPIGAAGNTFYRVKIR